MERTATREDEMSQPDNQKTMFTVTVRREFWTEQSRLEGRPVAIQEVVDRDAVEDLDLPIYQALGGFVSASAASPADAADIRFMNRPNPADGGPLGEGETEFSWLQIHEVDGKPVTAKDVLYVADMFGIAFAEGHDLEARRRAEADLAFEAEDFGDVVVEAHDGWETCGDRYTKVAFMDVGAEDTARMVFAVEFLPGTAGLVSRPEYDLPQRVEDAPAFGM